MGDAVSAGEYSYMNIGIRSRRQSMCFRYRLVKMSELAVEDVGICVNPYKIRKNNENSLTLSDKYRYNK